MTLLDGLDKDALYETLHNARQRLLDERNEHGWWTGELSSSALSTATAITALALIDRATDQNTHAKFIEKGANWLIDNQNDDGGWGDTDKSFSNISTTMLCWAALGIIGSRIAEGGSKNRNTQNKDKQNKNADASTTRTQAGPEESATKVWISPGSPDSTNPKSKIKNQKWHDMLTACEQWLANFAGSLAVPDLVEAVMKRYGKDRTFSVPILTMCALCGRLGDSQDRATWKWVKQLPFEYAALPQSWFNKVNLQVVSYALPALIAIGQVRHHHRPTRNPITRLFRRLAKSRTLRRLDAIQPPNGGFLEATPLTSFVTMSLAESGHAEHAVAQRGVEFITNSMRDDGSWPIDTNLATWVTTLSVNALAAGGKLNEQLDEQERATIRDWLLGQQYTEVHPYTGAKPGGWSWTDLPGGVPDADDTSGAVLALHHLGVSDDVMSRATAGLSWLDQVQNRDGGIPTFCRGWGKLPFDRSSSDITAHYVSAKQEWWRALHPEEAAESDRLLQSGDIKGFVDGLNERKPDRHFSAAIEFLYRKQHKIGYWEPLWFGCQQIDSEQNQTYGTSKVVPHVEDDDCFLSHESKSAGISWLVDAQNTDGGWGGGYQSEPSIEETALATDALATTINQVRVEFKHGAAKRQLTTSIVRGVQWLIENTQCGTYFPPSPIGFYFAKLWYYEKLYPIIYTVAALERVAALLEQNDVKEDGPDKKDEVSRMKYQG